MSSSIKLCLLLLSSFGLVLAFCFLAYAIYRRKKLKYAALVCCIFGISSYALDGTGYFTHLIYQYRIKLSSFPRNFAYEKDLYLLNPITTRQFFDLTTHTVSLFLEAGIKHPDFKDFSLTHIQREAWNPAEGKHGSVTLLWHRTGSGTVPAQSMHATFNQRGELMDFADYSAFDMDFLSTNTIQAQDSSITSDSLLTSTLKLIRRIKPYAYKNYRLYFTAMNRTSITFYLSDITGPSSLSDGFSDSVFVSYRRNDGRLISFQNQLFQSPIPMHDDMKIDRQTAESRAIEYIARRYVVAVSKVTPTCWEVTIQAGRNGLLPLDYLHKELSLLRPCYRFRLYTDVSGAFFQDDVYVDAIDGYISSHSHALIIGPSPGIEECGDFNETGRVVF